MSKTTIRNIIISLILITASAGTFMFMVYYVVDQGSRLEDQISILEEERAQEAAYIKLRRITKETEIDRQQLSSYFLARESDSIDFLNQVESLAPESGISLETRSLVLIKDASDDSEWIQSTFSLSGSREELKHFIKILETLPYVSRVTDVKMSARSSSEWHADVTMRVRVLTYDK